MGRHPNNKVWEYFDCISDKIAKCRSCRAEISIPKGSRGNMVRHLFQLHGINTYTGGQKSGIVLKKIPSKRGREFDESFKGGEYSNSFVNFQNEVSAELNSQDVEHEESNDAQMKDNNNGSILSSDGLHHADVQVLNEAHGFSETLITAKIEKTTPRKVHLQDNDHDDNDKMSNDNNDGAPNAPLIDFMVEPQESPSEYNTSAEDKHYAHHSLPHSPYLHHFYQTHHPTSEAKNVSERLTSEALAEKLKAETRYFNELADLTRSRRILVDLQCEKLRIQIKKL